uniref:Putative secreted protein n=1 Tax=Anopheles darlingi TaxID=43151 RepID=A0A2M4D1C7_ANODA
MQVLMWLMSQAKVREYRAFAMACLFSPASCSFSGISVMLPRTLICRLSNTCTRSASCRPSRCATIFTISSSPGASSHRSPSTSAKFRFPNHIMALSTRKIPSISGCEICSTLKANRSASKRFDSSAISAAD